MAQGVSDYTRNMADYRDTKMREARLPSQVHDSVAGDNEALLLGARFNSLYTKSLREARSKYARLVTSDARHEARLRQQQTKRYNALVMDYVREVCETFLDEQPEARHTAILRGAMVSREMNRNEAKKTTSDSAFWQRGRIAQTSLNALHEVGLLGEVREEMGANGKRLVHYPTPEKSARTVHYEPVQIRQVWFNRIKADTPVKMKDIAPATQKQQKEAVRFLAQRPHEQGGFLGRKLRVGERFWGASSTPVLEDDEGNVFGTLKREDAALFRVGDEVIIRTAKGSDGNLRAMVERVD